MTLAPCVALAVSVLFFGMRLMKREAADTLLALVAAKRHYVRYIRCAFEPPGRAVLRVIQAPKPPRPSPRPQPRAEDAAQRGEQVRIIRPS